MKQYIYKINQYLLEKHPTIWNTRLLWMLLISICFHLFFFLLGVFALTNPETLQEKRSIDIFFDSGTVFFSVVVSILQIVVWLIYMFKNNSFKNYYPTSKTKIFLQFICYLVITFATTSYILSHYAGLKTYINSKYPDKEFRSDIDVANKASAFFSHSVDDYTIDNCRYPFPFDSIYVETSRVYSPNYEWLDNRYQFYTLKILSSKNIKGDNPVKGYEYYKDTKDGETLYFFKDSEVDILTYKDNINTISDYVTFSEHNFHKDSTYRNFKSIKIKVPTGDVTYAGVIKYKTKDSIGTIFYEDDKKDLKKYKINVVPSYKYYSNVFYSPEYNEYQHTYFLERNSLKNKQNEKVCQLLKRNDSTEIKQLLKSFLTITSKYKIKNNITVGEWFKLIYHPNHFKVTSFIKKDPGYSELQQKVDFSRKELTKTEDFQYQRTTDYFIKTDKLHKAFDNIEEVKKNDDYKDFFHVLLWLSFFLSTLIFMFRISGLKTFIFTIISICVLLILIALLSISYRYFFGRYILDNDITTILSCLICFLIIIISFFFTEKILKKVMAVFINLSLGAFVFFLLSAVNLISNYQRHNCKLPSSKDCFILINEIGASWFSYILFIAGIVYLYFYSGIIKKWKGLPER